MPQKIKITKLSKPTQYVDSEKQIFKSKVNKLLQSSDWTQLPDAQLSMVNVLQWRYWRNSVRHIPVMDEIALRQLISVRPDCDFNRESTYKYITHDFNFESVDKFRDSCILILNEYFNIIANQRLMRYHSILAIYNAFMRIIARGC